MATTVLLRFDDAAGKSGHTAPSLTEGSLIEGGRTLSGLSAAVCPNECGGLRTVSARDRAINKQTFQTAVNNFTHHLEISR